MFSLFNNLTLVNSIYAISVLDGRKSVSYRYDCVIRSKVFDSLVDFLFKLRVEITGGFVKN